MENMMNVVCINERRGRPGQITVGKEYTIDRDSIYIDCDGDVYGEVYLGKWCVGRMNLSHFKSI